jgi:hypothetical protein
MDWTQCRMVFPMTASRYLKLRKALGSQENVAATLGVDIRTVQRREAENIPITPEAARAIMALYARQQVRNWLDAQEGAILPGQGEQLFVLLK